MFTCLLPICDDWKIAETRRRNIHAQGRWWRKGRGSLIFLRCINALTGTVRCCRNWYSAAQSSVVVSSLILEWPIKVGEDITCQSVFVHRTAEKLVDTLYYLLRMAECEKVIAVTEKVTWRIKQVSSYPVRFMLAADGNQKLVSSRGEWKMPSFIIFLGYFRGKRTGFWSWTTF